MPMEFPSFATFHASFLQAQEKDPLNVWVQRGGPAPRQTLSAPTMSDSVWEKTH